MRIPIFFITMLLSILVMPLAAEDIYVSPEGSEEADGSITRPYKLEEAQLAARSFLGKEEVHILLMDGIYYLDKTLEFSDDDGGTREYPVYYHALNEGQAIISGGKPLDVEWEAYQDGIYVCRVPNDLYYDQLFINDQRREMARFPNSKEGKNVFDCWTLSHSAEPDPENDPLSQDRISSWEDPSGAYLHAMHRALWGGMHYQVNGKTADGDLDLEGGWQNNRPDRMHQTYRFIEHVFEELDAPGEWYHDRDGSLLYYYPQAGQDLDQALGILQSMQDELEIGKIDYTRRCAAISIYGPHFSERPAIAGTVFEAASEAGVEILLIATSFSTVTFLTTSRQADQATARLNENFLVP